MPLPRPKIETTAQVPNGDEPVTVRAMSRVEATNATFLSVLERVQSMDFTSVGGDGPLADLSTAAWAEIYMLSCGLDVGSDDDALTTTREWWEDTPAVFVDDIVSAVARISGFERDADGRGYQRGDDQRTAGV